MRDKAFIFIFPIFCLATHVLAASASTTETKEGVTARPPATYANEEGTRILTVQWNDFGKVQITQRSAWEPGAYSFWHGEGRQKENGIVFSKVVEDGEDKGTEYLAAVSQSKLSIKINPGQGKGLSGELTGVYHHVSDEKLTALAKKDSVAAEKKLEDAIKVAAKNAVTADKPAITEWKHRWPELRSKLASRMTKPVAASSPTTTASKPSSAKSKPALSGKSTTEWLALAEASANGIRFISQSVTKETKAEWDGDYEDGFGGTVSLKLQKSGALEFSFRCTRTPESEEVYYAGDCPPRSVKAKTSSQEASADYADQKEEVEGSAQKTQVHFKLHGRYLLVEIEYPRSFMSRAWVDGIYLKRPPPKEQ